MKKAIIYKILQELQSNPALMKKVKVFALVGIVGLFIVGGLAIWATVSAVKYLTATANQVVTSDIAQEHVERVKTEVANVKSEIGQMQLKPLDCLGKAQSLMALEPWLTTPVDKHVSDLLAACLGGNFGETETKSDTATDQENPGS